MTRCSQWMVDLETSNTSDSIGSLSCFPWRDLFFCVAYTRYFANISTTKVTDANKNRNVKGKIKRA